MDLGLKGQVAIVTGGSRGIGRSIALALAEEGCIVVITGRTNETLVIATREIEAVSINRNVTDRSDDKLPPVLSVQADMVKAENIDRLVKQVIDIYGRIDILVNNVGGSFGGGDFEKSNEEQWRTVFEFNLFAALNTSKAVIPHMKARKWGRIINISSIWGREGGGGAAYNAGKAAEISLAKSMASSLAPYGILVNSVAPGSILFPGGGWAQRLEKDPAGMKEFVMREMPLGRFGKPEEVASVVAFLASEKASLVTGACWAVDGCQGHSNI